MVVVTGKDFGRDSGLSPYVPAVEEGQSVSVSTDALWENVLAALAREADTHQQWVDACAALTTLRERLEAVERERDEHQSVRGMLFLQCEEIAKRADTAEARVRDLEALLAMATDPDRWDEFLAAIDTKERART